MKVYIMATPCSGKTTYIKKTKKFDNIVLHDHDAYDSCYAKKLFELPENSCILGRVNETHQEGIIYLTVIIPMEELERNLASRIAKEPNHGWNNLDLILNHPTDGRFKLEEVSKRFNIPIFQSFTEALLSLRDL